MAAIVAAGVVRRQKKIVAALRAAGAVSADRATTAEALSIREGMAFRILRRNEVVREAPGERIYLDEPSWEAKCARRRRLAIVIPGIVLLAGLAGALWASRR